MRFATPVPNILLVWKSAESLERINFDNFQRLNLVLSPQRHGLQEHGE